MFAGTYSCYDRYDVGNTCGSFFMAQNITSLPYSDQQASICEKADRMHSSLLPAPYFVFQVFPYSPHRHVSPL